jgi:hypothetical protein
MQYPLRHISIRVPWHDTGWDGRVCAAPRLNGACLKLNRIADSRDDAAEEAIAGRPLIELPLTIDGVTKYPDFTVEGMESGETFYWEHCGMLHVPRYKQRWEAKLDWYRSHGIRPLEEGGGDRATLIVTRDEPNGSIDSAKIDSLISDVLAL